MKSVDDRIGSKSGNYVLHELHAIHLKLKTLQTTHGQYVEELTSLTFSNFHLKLQVLNANKDRNTVVLNVLHHAITARYIRLHPKTWRGHISMRMELLGCASGTD